MRIAETRAADAAAVSWLAGDGVRGALARYGIDFDDVREWAEPGRFGCFQAAGDAARFEGRFAGAVSAAIILGIELGRSGELG